jgi:P27 family predicted phage terminase small subunit
LQSSGVAPAPPILGAAGVAMWNHVWEAGRKWLSPDVDFTIVRLLCEAADEMDEIRSLLDSGEVARTYTTSNGTIVTHPFVVQLKDLRVQMTSWLAAIGFSPSDRARLGLAEVRVRNELDDLERRRRERTTGTE